MSLDPAPLVQTAGLTKSFGSRHDLFGRPRLLVRAVDDVSLSIARGETLGLVGESGCGKSTLGNLLIRLEDADNGEVVFDGQRLTDLNERELRRLRRRFQIIFQDPQSSLDPRMTVRAIVAEPLTVAGWSDRAKIAERVAFVLETVGLGREQMSRFPHEFSGGQRQRIAIARALTINPDFLVLDEPTSALDVSVQAQVLNLLKELQERFSLTYLFISHNMAVIRYMSDRIAVMYLGRTLEVAPSASLFAAPRHPYTRTLLQAIPSVVRREPAGWELPIIEGDPPSQTSPPPGCHFHPRCPLRMPECSVTQPALAQVGLDHSAACLLYRVAPQE
ncbi:MAG: ABC transporter ATP-binding protein [Bacillota bacterium]|nr:ABC transporter ATP-binding protein [Bacillota bacterium]